MHGLRSLADCGYLAAARAYLPIGIGRSADARRACEEALMLTEISVERYFLTGRLTELSPQAPRAWQCSRGPTRPSRGFAEDRKGCAVRRVEVLLPAERATIWQQ